MWRIAQISGLLLVLIGVSIYIIMDPKSVTALIPAFGGVVILGCSPSMRKGNKLAAHIAVLVTFILLVGMIKPISGMTFSDLDTTNYLSLAAAFVALTAFLRYLRSFMIARKKA